MLNYKIQYFDNVASTNSLLKERARKGETDKTVLVSRIQSAGHGQFGRSFESPEGGLYLSILRRLPLPFEHPEDLTVSMGKAVQNAIKKLCELETDIKLPNDILFDGKKLCGILAESFSFGGEINIIIGIGLNVNTEAKAFSAELQGIATSLKSTCGREFDINELLFEILKEVDAWFNSQKQF